MLTRRGAIAAVAFGMGAMVVVVAGLTIPIAGTRVVTDPREVFTTLGAALSGPVGGVIVGLLASVRESDMVGASVIAHVAGGVWMGFAYKRLVYDRLAMPWFLVGWIAIVLAYYFVFAVPGFAIGGVLLYSTASPDLGSVVAATLDIARGAMPEAVVTAVVTALVLLALPRRYRRPLW